MPLTPEQREEKVRLYYAQLKESGISVPEKEIKEAIQWTKGEENQELAAGILENKENRRILAESYQKEGKETGPYGKKTDLLEPRLNGAGNKAAEEQNREFMKRVRTEQGYKQFIQEQVMTAYNFDVRELESLKGDALTEKMGKAEFREKLETTVKAREYLMEARELKLEGFPPDVVEKCLANSDLAKNPYDRAMKELNNVASSEAAAFIKPDGKTVKKALDKPEIYWQEKDVDNDAAGYLFQARDYLGKDSEKENERLAQVMAYLTGQNLQADGMNVNALLNNQPLHTRKTEAGEGELGQIREKNAIERDQIHLMGKDGKVVSWDSHYSYTTTEATTDTVLEELRTTRDLLQKTAKVGDGSSKEFREMMTDLNKLIQSREKNREPGKMEKDLEQVTRDRELNEKLSRSIENYWNHKREQVAGKPSERGEQRLELTEHLRKVQKVHERFLDRETKEIEKNLDKTGESLQNYMKEGRLVQSDGTVLTGQVTDAANRLRTKGENGDMRFYLRDQNTPGMAKEISYSGGKLVEGENVRLFDEKNQKGTREALSDVYEEMKKLGTTRKDSKEFGEMMDKCEKVIKTLDTTMKKEDVRKSLEDLKEAADKYYVGKLDQSANARRTGRLLGAAQIENICNASLSGNVNRKMNKDDLLKQVIQDKIVKTTAALGAEKSENPDNRKLCGEILADPKKFHEARNVLKNTDEYKNLIARTDENEPAKKYSERLLKLAGENGMSLAAKINKPAPERTMGSPERNNGQNRTENSEVNKNAVKPDLVI